MTSVESGVFAPVGHREFIMPDVKAPDLQALLSTQEYGALPKTPDLPFLERRPIELEDHPLNAKDASLDPRADRIRLYASINNGTTQSGWIEQVYEAPDLSAPSWRLVGEVKMNGVDREFIDEDGERFENTLVASGVTPGGEVLLQQERCFGPGGRILYLVGDGPTNFEFGGVALRPDLEKGIVGLYDAEPVDGLGPRGGVINRETGEEEFFMTVTTVGKFVKEKDRKYYPKEGTISLAKRSGNWAGEYQLIDEPIINEYQNFGHVPTSQGGEWVPEGGKTTEVDADTSELRFVHQSRDESGNWRLEMTSLSMDDLSALNGGRIPEIRFVHYFTAFIDGPKGSRQRGFIGISSEITEPPIVLGMIKPMSVGETGHGTIHRIRREAPVELPHAA